jgi:uncharacterized protein
MIKEEITFFGHRNIRCLHSRTIEITRNSSLSVRGDCIAGVSASKACKDLDGEFKARLCDGTRRIFIEISVNTLSFDMHGFTDQHLTLTHADDIVIRRSRYLCPRTVCVLSDKGSRDMPRNLVKELQNPATVAKLTMSIE